MSTRGSDGRGGSRGAGRGVRTGCLLLGAGVLLLGAIPSFAQVQRSGGGAASAQLMQQYQQAITEREKLQADNQKLKKDLDDTKKQLDAAKKDLAAAKAGNTRGQAELAAAQAASQTSAKNLTDTNNKMKELIGQFRDTIANLRHVETERSELQTQLAQSKLTYDKCAQTNYQLYQVTDEVLNRLSHEGPFSCAARAEPFTRLRRTQIDNMVLEYKQRALELQLKKPAVPGAAAISPSAPGATPIPTSAPSAAPAAAATPAPR
jgi:chromosome segregation ATPase